MELSKKTLVCPYCKKSFRAEQILFCAEPSENFRAISKDRVEYGETQERVQVQVMRGGRPMAAVSRGVSARGVSSRGVTANQSEETGKVEKATAGAEFPLGVKTDDTVLTEFYKRYGEGNLFRYNRTATFYGIKEKSDITEADTAYGYVELFESGTADNGIPLTLYVPSRANDHILTYRICPECHNDIPSEYFTCDPANRHEIALAGSTAAGKTQFLTVGLRELTSSFERTLHQGSCELSGPSKKFHEMYLNEYSGNEGTLNATPTTFPIFPFVLSVTGNAGNGTAFFTFHDCAGEYSDAAASGARGSNLASYFFNKTSFGEADILLVMLDSTQFFGKNVKLADNEGACDKPYLEALKPLKKYGIGKNIKTAIAVVTKCDGIFGRPEYIHANTAAGVADCMEMVSSDMSAHTKAVDTGLIDRVEREMLNLLNGSVGEDVKQELSKELGGKEFKVLPVSTYVRTMDGNGSVKLTKDLNAEDGHFRLIEPLLYMFWKTGIVNGEEKAMSGNAPVWEDTEKREGWIKRLFHGKNK